MPLPPEVEFLGVRGGAEAWALGKVMVIMPRRRDNWPDALREAWYRRLQANLTLRCECGAIFTSAAPNTGQMRHEANCPAADERFAELLEAEG
jgi:hypothetical protein